MSYHLSKKLFHYLIRVPKAEASFLYFNLESHEGLCFYSTLDDSIHEGYRDIDLKGPIEWQGELDHLLAVLSKDFPIEFLKKDVFLDQTN